MRVAKRVLQQLAQWKYDPRVRQRAVFLEDYDQEIADSLSSRLTFGSTCRVDL